MTTFKLDTISASGHWHAFKPGTDTTPVQTAMVKDGQAGCIATADDGSAIAGVGLTRVLGGDAWPNVGDTIEHGGRSYRVSYADRETPINAGKASAHSPRSWLNHVLAQVGEARRGETTQAMWDAQGHMVTPSRDG